MENIVKECSKKLWHLSALYNDASTSHREAVTFYTPKQEFVSVATVDTITMNPGPANGYAGLVAPPTSITA